MKQQRNTSTEIKGAEWLNKTRIAFIRAHWHFDIVEECRKSFVASMGKFGVKKKQIELFDVPGSFEIPLQAKLLAKTTSYDLIVGCGFVINGGIYRHEFVAQAVITGMMQVQLETEVPVLSAVLTPHHFHESPEHHQFFFNHFKKKGEEVANAAKEVLKNNIKLAKIYKR